MDTAAENKQVGRIHSLTMVSRKKLQLTGVNNVDSFNETAVMLTTTEGALSIAGKQLSVAALNVADGTLSVEGRIDALKYRDDSDKKLLKLFK